MPLAMLLQLPSHLVLQPRALKLSVGCNREKKKKKKKCRMQKSVGVCVDLRRSSGSQRMKRLFSTFSYESLFAVGSALIGISVIRQFSKRISQSFKRHCCHFIIFFLHPASVTMDACLQHSYRFDCYKYQAYVIWEEWCALTSVKGR